MLAVVALSRGSLFMFLYENKIIMFGWQVKDLMLFGLFLIFSQFSCNWKTYFTNQILRKNHFQGNKSLHDSFSPGNLILKHNVKLL